VAVRVAGELARVVERIARDAGFSPDDRGRVVVTRSGDEPYLVIGVAASRGAWSLDRLAIDRVAELGERLEAAVLRAQHAERLRTSRHDVRGALAVIQGHLDLLGHGFRGPVNDAQRASLEAIQRGIDKAAAALSDDS
jgi:signal transduction histidine kinase